MDKFFIVIYTFFSSVLGLKGLAKEVFGAIFGFWLKCERTEVRVSITTLQKMTGGSRPAIVDALKLLEEHNYIKVIRTAGKHSRFSITLNADILQDFEATFAAKAVRAPTYQVVKSPDQKKLIDLHGTSKLALPHKINEEQRLRVSTIVDKGSLKEV